MIEADASKEGKIEVNVPKIKEKFFHPTTWKRKSNELGNHKDALHL